MKSGCGSPRIRKRLLLAPLRLRRYPSSPFLRCNTVTVIYLGDFGALSHIQFLQLSSFRAVVRMLYNSTVKNRYSFDEPRNLSRVREYRAFCRLPLRQSRDSNSKGGASKICSPPPPFLIPDFSAPPPCRIRYPSVTFRYSVSPPPWLIIKAGQLPTIAKSGKEFP